MKKRGKMLRHIIIRNLMRMKHLRRTEINEVIINMDGLLVIHFCSIFIDIPVFVCYHNIC